MRSINLLSGIEVKTLITILFAIALSLSVACDSNKNNDSGQGDGGNGGDTPGAPAQASACDGLTPTMTGTAGDDMLQGTGGDDVILGLAGNDTLIGGGGNDVLCGNEGDDELQGGDGNDILDGGPDNDLMVGGGGDDVFVEVPGSIDEIDAGEGSDTLDFSNITDADVISRGAESSLSGVALDLSLGLVSPAPGIGLGIIAMVDEQDGIAFKQGGPILIAPSLLGSPFDDIFIVGPSPAPRTLDGEGGVNTLIFDALGQPVAFNNNVFQTPGFGDSQLLNFAGVQAVNFVPIILDDSNDLPAFRPDPEGGCFPSGDTQGNNGVTFCPPGENSRGTWTFENPPPANDVAVGITYVSNPPDRSDDVWVNVFCETPQFDQSIILQSMINQKTPPGGFSASGLTFDLLGTMDTQECVSIIIEALNMSANPNFFLELDSVALVPKEFFDITPPIVNITSPTDGSTVDIDNLQLSFNASDDSNTTFLPVTIQFPEIEICRVRTTVTVPDGGTLLLGGLKERCFDDEGFFPRLVKIIVQAFDFSGNSSQAEIDLNLIDE